MKTHTHPLEVEDGTVIAVLSDIHIPHHDEHVLKLVVDCCEDAGVDIVVLNGDIADCGAASRHPDKKATDIISSGTLAESVDVGRWLIDWAREHECHYMLGNHERWVEKALSMDAILRDTVTPMDVMGLPEDGDGWSVYPSNARLRFGNFVIEHGHGIFAGGGGQNPGNRIKAVAPEQVTMIGHLHRKFATWWTTPDSKGIPRTKAAFGNGHLSLEDSHESYAGAYPGWQQSFAIIKVWKSGKEQRYTVDQPEIFRSRKGKPVFEYQGVVYE